jgi:hypothetical protein
VKELKQGAFGNGIAMDCHEWNAKEHKEKVASFIYRRTVSGMI